jgi:hypothetical protein
MKELHLGRASSPPLLSLVSFSWRSNRDGIRLLNPGQGQAGRQSDRERQSHANKRTVATGMKETSTADANSTGNDSERLCHCLANELREIREREWNSVRGKPSTLPNECRARSRQNQCSYPRGTINSTVDRASMS